MTDAVDAARRLRDRWLATVDGLIDDVNHGHAPLSEADFARGMKSCANELDALVRESEVMPSDPRQTNDLRRPVEAGDQHPAANTGTDGDLAETLQAIWRGTPDQPQRRKELQQYVLDLANAALVRAGVEPTERKPFKLDVSKEWCEKMATLEEGYDVSVLGGAAAGAGTPPAEPLLLERVNLAYVNRTPPESLWVRSQDVALIEEANQTLQRTVNAQAAELVTLRAGASVPASPPQELKHLALAMRKLLPPRLFAEVLEHLDPLTPFVTFLREYDAQLPAAALAGVPSPQPAPKVAEYAERCVERTDVHGRCRFPKGHDGRHENSLGETFIVPHKVSDFGYR